MSWGTKEQYHNAKNSPLKKALTPCCRLQQEYIMAIVRNRSGIDSGRIDYNIQTDRFDRMSEGCLLEALETIKVLTDKIKENLNIKQGEENV